MNDVTILVIVNNRKQYSNFLHSLDEQKGVSYNCIPIYNENNNNFQSARPAYNSELSNVSGKYVMLCHPDIVFLDEYALKDIVGKINALENIGVIGIAGCPDGKHRNIYSTMLHGLNRKLAGIPFEGCIKVQTVDECCFIMKSNKYFRFSDIEGWHMYAVEECLNALLKGKDNYVVESRVWHISDGRSLDHAYMTCLESIIHQYKNDFEYINTTVKQWKTKGFAPFIYRKYYYLKQYVKKRLIRKI